MKSTVTATLLALAGLVAAEVPQEHCHEAVVRAVRTELNKNNPLAIQDPIFALLGNAAAATGAPNVDASDLDCLQQIVADQAFTNAKADNNVDGMVAALMFATIERNTLSVGLASVVCTTVKATNPEIAALTRIQDPASAEGKAGNKQAILDLAVQIAAVGGDPTKAVEAGTFEPGQIGDPTGAGNTCDDENDAVGCIISQNKLVVLASNAEIQAAVAAAGGSANNGTGNANNNTNNDSNNNADSGNACNAANNTGNANTGNNNNDSTGDSQSSSNVQTFTGALGGAAPAVSFDAGADRPFTVNGNTFTTAKAALTRSCDIQNNACFNAVNGGTLSGGTAQCSTQQSACIASVDASAAAVSKARRSVKLHARRVRRSTTSYTRRQATGEFGSCQDPSIQFVAGLDGRKEASFGPAGDFNHGSALNINIISSFICQQLESRCKASATAVEDCQQGQAAASGLKGQAAADAFNSALGV